jgi:hypothetical protein
VLFSFLAKVMSPRLHSSDRGSATSRSPSVTARPV